MATIIDFPTRPRLVPEPDAVRVVYDFSLWCVEYFGRGRLLRREVYQTRAEADREAARLRDECGLTRMPDPLPDFSTMIFCLETRS